MLLTDIVIDGIPEVDWTLHVPIMLHILFLGLDHTRPIVRDHCKQLLLNLLVNIDSILRSLRSASTCLLYIFNFSISYRLCWPNTTII